MLEIVLVAVGGAVWYGVSPGDFVGQCGRVFYYRCVYGTGYRAFEHQSCWRLLIAVGFLGGLTTFSSFSYETLRLLQDADVLRAFYNVGLNVLVGLLATWLGMGFAKLF